MKRIKLTQGKWAIVDDDMYEVLNKFKWSVHKSHGNFYAIRGFIIKDRILTKIGSQAVWGIVKMHHCVLGFPLKGKQLDHIDGNGLNNCLSNLRVVTIRENCSNRRDRRNGETKSNYVGVYQSKGQTNWRSQISINRKSIHLGCFENEKKASEAYQNALTKLEGGA